MLEDTRDACASLLELVNTDTDMLLACQSCPDDVPQRRTHLRLEPVEDVTLRIDVLEGIWSAKVKEISTGSACLQLDREIAHQVEDGQPASIWLESRRGAPIRLDGSLRTIRDPGAAIRDEPITMTFSCG